MKVIRAYPPNFSELAKVFPIKGKPGILYAWGDRLYNPSGVKVTPWILAHEETHGSQQMHFGLDEWWWNYINKADFRRIEEVLAHRYEWLAYSGPDPDAYLDMMSKRLSSPLYGRLLTYDAARRAITNGV
jgi:hypothetical protein